MIHIQDISYNQNANTQISERPRYIDTFERTEKKYILSKEQHLAIMQELVCRLEPDAHPQSTVASLYYDTPEHEIITHSLAKPLYKEKLRVRAYLPYEDLLDENADSKEVFIELKKKFKGIVYKRRVGLSPDAAYAFLQGADFEQSCALFPVDTESQIQSSISTKSKQVAKEIRMFCRRFAKLQTDTLITCRRNAWCDPQSDLRITFDADIFASKLKQDDFYFVHQGEVRNLLKPEEVLMEIKKIGGLPLWLVKLLSQNNIYPQSFSKFGKACELEQIEKQEKKLLEEISKKIIYPQFNYYYNNKAISF